MAAPPDLSLQPDQQSPLWDRHVDRYEAVFEPLTNALATRALDGLEAQDAIGTLDGRQILDVGAGAGGAALIAALRGALVTAIDAAPAMVERIAARAREAGDANVTAVTMDGTSLAFPDETFDACLSLFGVVLFPDPVPALREMRRVLRPNGRLALATWTRPDRYELVTRLFAAISAVRGPQPAPDTVPAQLRFREEQDLRALLEAGGFTTLRVMVEETRMEARSATWLAEHLDFAPGMSALLAGQAASRSAVLDRFVADLEQDQGVGAVSLEAVAFVALASPAETVSGKRRDNTPGSQG